MPMKMATGCASRQVVANSQSSEAADEKRDKK
jgi:hypothetical protein